MTDCTVCCETYNKSTKKKITCCFCDYELCRGCTSTYLVTTTNEPHCMQCKHVWTRDFLGNNLTKKFIDKDLKKHRENVLFTREKCLLPESQEYASNILTSRKMKDKIEEMSAELHRGWERLNILRNHQLIYASGGTPAGVNVAPGSSSRRFVRQCPSEECKGFLSSAWKCGMCSKNFCVRCNDEKGENHVCDDDMVKTMKLLKNDTKPCPKCSTMIFKIEGCAQMWCTSCGTGFSWNTGRIEKGVIHNPHYYEMQRNGDFVHRNAGDIPCGGLPHVGELRDAIGGKGRADIDTIYRCHRFVNHVTNYQLVFHLVVEETDNNHLRVQYLLNDITEDEMKKQLQIKDKAHHKVRDWRDLIEMLSHTLSDLFRQLILKDIDIIQFMDHSEKLREYSNNEFLVISKRYNCVYKYVSKDWSYLGL